MRGSPTNWPHICLSVDRGEKLSSPAIVALFDWVHHYISIAIQIPQEVELAAIPYTGQKLFPTRNWTSITIVQSSMS